MGLCITQCHKDEARAAAPKTVPSCPAHQPSQHIGPPWCPATRCRTRWETAPPGGGQTPDTLSDKGEPLHITAIVCAQRHILKAQRHEMILWSRQGIAGFRRYAPTGRSRLVFQACEHFKPWPAQVACHPPSKPCFSQAVPSA